MKKMMTVIMMLLVSLGLIACTQSGEDEASEATSEDVRWAILRWI